MENTNQPLTSIEAQALLLLIPQPKSINLVTPQSLPQVVEAPLPKFTKHTPTQPYYMANTAITKDSSIQ